MRRKFMELINRVLIEHTNEEKQIEKIRDALNEGIGLEELRTILMAAQMTNNKKHRIYREIMACLPESDIYHPYIAEPTVKIEECQCGYHFILSELLPRRQKYNTKAQEMIYLQERDFLYAGYRSGVVEYIKEHTITRIKGKACAVFINYFNEKEQMCDHDNVDQKIFVDAVLKNYFIEDDSPEHLCHFIDYKYGEYTHTEVYLGRVEDIMETKPWESIDTE